MFTPPRKSVVILFSSSHSPSGVWAPQRPLCRSRNVSARPELKTYASTVPIAYFCGITYRCPHSHQRLVEVAAVHRTGCSRHPAIITSQVQYRRARPYRFQMYLLSCQCYTYSVRFKDKNEPSILLVPLLKPASSEGGIVVISISSIPHYPAVSH